MSNEHHRFASLTTGNILCAVASLLVVATLSVGQVDAVRLLLVALIQVMAIGFMMSARIAMTRHLASLDRVIESDPATGCLNRRGFARALDEALTSAARAEHEVALLAIDLDHFKEINDRFGHNVGDAVLCEVAGRLSETVGADGVVARLGGEEFSVLLPNADAEAAGVMAERLLSSLRANGMASVPPRAEVTMSVGIAAERVSSTRDSAALRARADEALYSAKRSGRNRVRLWAPGVRSLATPAAAAAAIVTEQRWAAARPLLS